MGRRLGIDVPEGQTTLVLVDDIRRNFAGDDLAEQSGHKILKIITYKQVVTGKGRIATRDRQALDSPAFFDAIGGRHRRQS
jgi:hypothetical protein